MRYAFFGKSFFKGALIRSWKIIHSKGDSMTKLNIYTVAQDWYNMDSSSPSDAWERDDIAHFDNIEAAELFRTQEEAEFKHWLEHVDEDKLGCHEWYEKREYVVYTRESMIIYSSLEEVRRDDNDNVIICE